MDDWLLQYQDEEERIVNSNWATRFLTSQLTDTSLANDIHMHRK